ncbi:MAG: PorT family protein, partial [Bacteroidetes bacterium]|nr:PorT family protein [Bacteroidota bacterium]
MKKIILMAFAIAFTANISKAQDNTTDYRDKLMFGLKAGGNYSNVYDSKSESFNADPKTGLAAGAFVAIPMGTYFGLQPEVLFSQKGFKSTRTTILGTHEYTRTTNFIDVPLLFSLKPSEFITFVAGPQYSFLLKQRDVYTTGATSTGYDQNFDNSNIRRNLLCFTGGMDITLKHLVLGIR